MDTQETSLYLAIIISVVIIGTIIIYFAVSVIRQQRRNLELQKAYSLAEISAMEKERARIAADLHDDLGPVLSVVKFRVDNVETINVEEKEELVKASQQLDELIARMREVANNLMPSALIRKGLINAVQEFTSNASASSGVMIRFTASEDIQAGEEKNINIYRIVQEVVHNCMKHAKASRLDISIEAKNGNLVLLCRDNGKGFDYTRMITESGGIGLRSIKNRTEIMGGNLRVESKPGVGTAFLFEIPLK